jgi:hypothetical protein
MDRLTKQTKFPLTDFKRCQLCGFVSNDICEFCMWFECDDQDKVEADNILVLCQKKDCKKVVDSHPRLYVEIPWSRGGPGKFMLLCGNCEHRNGTKCKHPQLKENGGPGLKVNFAKTIISEAFICFSREDGSSYCLHGDRPATECEGQTPR